MKKHHYLIISIVAAGVGLGIAFYGGLTYGKSLSSSFQSPFQAGNPQQRMGQGAPLGSRQNGGLANGEILFMDDKSITIKLRDGGSKIVFFSDSTQISKSAPGTKDDLKVGEKVTAIGDPNPDGSITAKNLQM